MSLGHGASIVRDGLVFCYDMQNTQKSLKGAPTTNLLTNPDFASGNTGYTNYVSTGPTTVIVTDFPGSIGVPKTVLECTSASAPGGGGNSGGMVFANPTLTTGQAYTISFWARILSHSSATNTFSNQSGSGDNSNFSFTKTITSEWVKYSYTTSSLDLMKTSWYVWTNLNSARWQYADFQIEQNTFETPFVRGTRSNTQAILDITNNNTVTASSLTYASNNTFSFNGSSNLLIMPENTIFNNQNPTVEVWIKTNSLNQNGFFFEKGNVNTQYSLFQEGTTIVWRTHNGTLNSFDTQTISSSNIDTTNYWQIVGTIESGNKKIYVNGVEKASNAWANTIPTNTNGCSIGAYGGFNGARGYYYNGIISAVRVYNKALTATEIKQNFEAHRGRYGI